MISPMANTAIQLRPPFARAQQERRARRLAHLGNAWHAVEFGIALGAGIAAGSGALTRFAGDSLVEVLAASVIVWLFSAGRGTSARAEQQAQQPIASSYFLLVAYILSHALYDVTAGTRPS